ncbi:MAG TPA: hypothetical protein VJ697_11650 [Nitrososphaeraceae archaeon]|nr:hypothetical protein [Nitrososphaeraceae archaeon]
MFTPGISSIANHVSMRTSTISRSDDDAILELLKSMIRLAKERSTWCPQANFLHLKHRLHSPLDKSNNRKSNAVFQR